MAKNIDHAKHNKKLSENLLVGKVYYDWCITTSFYSALHFVDTVIFPFRLTHEIVCTDIREAQNKLRTSDLHETRAKMVELQCNEIAIPYRWLKNNAHNSRYITYKFQHSQAEKAIQYLKQIEKYCNSAPKDETSKKVDDQ